ncbi:germination protein YpeB [Halobacillus salinarum]|uniref:Germination protein YpeB n=1 Tax=Halobacillus salinarum TaxID=2932257 RepID=A0ABY4EGE5_9BACI|nr:germination protein YpeB [Halobacillus salinarum]UOQ42689.1 germination protein YpeB [Halobacillus salinarum]
MLRIISIVVLSLTTIGAGIWGYKEHQDKNAILVQSENNYQRAFHELTYYVDVLNDKIGTTLAMNSRKELSPQLAEIWRITSDANADVGQLPLSLMPFNKTEEFLSDIGDFAYRTAVRDLTKKPLSEKEVKALESLHKQSGEIKNELRKVQNVVLRDNLRWMDVELALATNNETGDNTIVDGFKTVEKSVDGFRQANIESGVSVAGTAQDFKNIKGKEISKQEAKSIAGKWLKDVKPKDLKITKSGKGADVQTYTASFQKNKINGYMDISVKGGHALTVMVNRPVKKAQVSLHEAYSKAKKYLEGLNVEDADFDLIESSQYERLGVFRFVYKKDGVRYYPDAIEVKVALDNGDLLGMTTLDYFSHHYDRDIKKANVSEEEAKSNVNPNLKIQEKHMAVIENDLNEQVLCYEFLATKGNETYRIFINAWNGEEEQVETLKGTEVKFNNI